MNNDKWSDHHRKNTATNNAWLIYQKSKAVFDIEERKFNEAFLNRENAEKNWRKARADADEAKLIYDEE